MVVWERIRTVDERAVGPASQFKRQCGTTNVEPDMTFPGGPG